MSLQPEEVAPGEVPENCEPMEEDAGKPSLIIWHAASVAVEQNVSGSTARKKRRKDWKALFNDNGAGRRRVLRSDSAKLRSEAEDAKRSALQEDEEEVIRLGRSEFRNKTVVLRVATNGIVKKDTVDDDCCKEEVGKCTVDGRSNGEVDKDTDVIDFAQEADFNGNKNVEARNSGRGEDSAVDQVVIEGSGTEMIKCEAEIKPEMRITTGFDKADAAADEVTHKMTAGRGYNKCNSAPKGCQTGLVECGTEVEDGKVGLGLTRDGGDESDKEKAAEHATVDTKEATMEGGFHVRKRTEESVSDANEDELWANVTVSTAIEQMGCDNNIKVERSNTSKERQGKEKAADGDNHRKCSSVTSKRNSFKTVNYDEVRVEKRITRSAAAKQKETAGTALKNLRQEGDSANKESRYSGHKQNYGDSIFCKSNATQMETNGEIDMLKRQIVDKDDLGFGDNAADDGKGSVEEQLSGVDYIDTAEFRNNYELQIKKKSAFKFDVVRKSKKSGILEELSEDAISGTDRNGRSSSIVKMKEKLMKPAEGFTVASGRALKEKREAKGKGADTIKKKLKESVLQKRRGTEVSSHAEPSRKKTKNESFDCKLEESKDIELSKHSTRRVCMISEKDACGLGAEKDIDSSHMKILRGHARGGSFVHVQNKKKRGRPKKIFTLRYKRGKSAKTKVKVNYESKSSSRQEERQKGQSSNGKTEEERSTLKAPSPSMQQNTACGSRREEKDKVRDLIKSILLSAGWKIDLRPRNGRDYEDSVYISPQGSGFWSITKAYGVYKSQLALSHDKMKGASRSPSKTRQGIQHNTTSSAFSLVPEELLQILRRKVVNKRRSKEELAKVIKKIGGNNKKLKRASNSKYTKKKNSKDDADDMKGKTRKNNTMNTSSKRSHSSKCRKKQGGCSLRVRGSNQQVGTSADNYVPYVYKRSVLSWIIDSNIVPANSKVKYMDQEHTKALLEGSITREGINCRCCNKSLTVYEFETHAGGEPCHPYQNILIDETGVYLSQCLLDAWEKQEDSARQDFYPIAINGDDPNDDTCGICGDGGDLICCDGCPSTFHMNCLDIQMLPLGDWRCRNCSCRFCGTVSTSDAQVINGADPLLVCSQCERKFHQICTPDTDSVPISSDLSGIPFCGQSCRKLFEGLQSLVGVKNDQESGFSCTVVQRLEGSLDVFELDQKVERNSKIAVAHAVMDECFLPIIDQRSGINLIHNVVYNCGSNFVRLNFRKFYTFILERGDEIVAAASLRIHGIKLAEMPFIGTRSMYRRQGMCRRLLHGIESVLRSLNVEKLIIPAISELVDTWTNVFGFRPLDGTPKQQDISVNMLVFPGTGLLEKPLLNKDSAEMFKITREAQNILAERGAGQTLDLANDTSICSFAGSEFDAYKNKVEDIEAPGNCRNSTTDGLHESFDPSFGSNFQSSKDKSSLGADLVGRESMQIAQPIHF